MKVRIEIECDNDAFHAGNCGAEVARILSALAGNMDGMKRAALSVYDGVRLRDLNGNTVGSVSVEE